MSLNKLRFDAGRDALIDADALELDGYARDLMPHELEAAVWATRRSEGLDAESEARFQAWLQAGPDHAAAYAELAVSLDPARTLPAEAVTRLREGLRPQPQRPRQPHLLPEQQPQQQRQVPLQRGAGAPSKAARGGRLSWSGTGTRRSFASWATAAVLLAFVAGGGFGWQQWWGEAGFNRDLATVIGQRLAFKLPDGSIVDLDAATRAQIRLDRQHREVRLLDGQAMFTVSRDPARPFEVWAGATRVTVVGTRFSVRHTRAGIAAGQTVIAVESGRVRVQPEAGESVELSAGQGLSVDEAGLPQGIVSVSADGIASWRNGRITFSDTPLAQALAELERYGPTGLVVRDPAVGALRLGGSFGLNEADVFVRALPVLLPVRLERRQGQTEVVARR